MKNTLAVCVARRRPLDETDRCLRALKAAGALLHLELGHSEIALGRSLAYTACLQGAREQGWPLADWVLLSIDDDMAFRVSDAQEVVSYTRSTGRAASGVCCTANGYVAAWRRDGLEWETGLAFTAIRMDKLAELADRLPLLRGTTRHGGVYPFCRTGIHPSVPNRWTSEDFWLSRELGGVDLLPIGIGHCKTWPLYPDAKTLDAIRNGTPLEENPPEIQHQGKWSERGAPVVSE